MRELKQVIISAALAEAIDSEILLETDKEEDLETTADILLQGAGVLGRPDGIYTQKQIIRKIRNEQQHMPRLDECELPPEMASYIFQRQIDDLIDAANLTQVQEIIYRLFTGGLKCAEIARTLKIRRQIVFAHLKSARGKIKAAYKDGIYAGWLEVYLGEIRRGKKC